MTHTASSYVTSSLPGRPHPQLMDWYCGLTFLNIEDVGSSFKKSKGFCEDEWDELIRYFQKRRKREEEIKIYWEEEGTIYYREIDPEPFFSLQIEEKRIGLDWKKLKSLPCQEGEDDFDDIIALGAFLEVMRQNGMMPRILKKRFKGIGEIELDDYSDPEGYRNIYASELGFLPAHLPPKKGELASFKDYPDWKILQKLLKTSGVFTEDPTLFREVVQRIEDESSLEIRVDQRLKNQFVNLSAQDFNSTLCEQLNTLATMLDAVWDFEGRAKIYFLPREDRSLLPQLHCYDGITREKT